ncbi:MAG TPA: S24 family peptidase [Candidatus Binatia bacterium]|nr:S24 family peptidase [Candidatus Binatia bacterium]
MEPDLSLSFKAAEVETSNSNVSLHAGFPNPSEQADSLSLDFNQLLVRHPSSTFVFRLRGHNWRNFGIWDRDLAVVDRVVKPARHDLVVWCEDDQAGFSLSQAHAVPSGAEIWGTITSLVHKYK